MAHQDQAKCRLGRTTEEGVDREVAAQRRDCVTGVFQQQRAACLQYGISTDGDDHFGWGHENLLYRLGAERLHRKAVLGPVTDLFATTLVSPIQQLSSGH